MSSNPQPLGSPPTTAFPPPSRKCAHLVAPWKDEIFTHEYIDARLAIAHDLGIDLIRLMVRWDKVEAEKGVFKFRKPNGKFDYAYFFEKAHEYGIRVSIEARDSPQWANGGDGSFNEGPPLDMDDFANYVFEMVKYFGAGGTLAQENGWPSTHRVAYSIEFWNEVNNNPGCWKVWDPAAGEYVMKREPERWAEGTIKGAAAAKKADPGILTISGPICTGTGEGGYDWKKYMDDAFNAGLADAFKEGLLDACTLNGYYGGGPNKLTPQEQLNDELGKIRANLDRVGATKAGIWIMEAGDGSVKNLDYDSPRQQKQSDTLLALYEDAGPEWTDKFGGEMENPADNFRIVWTLLTDQEGKTENATDFSAGGLVFDPVAWPIPEGGKKKAYDTMKNLAP